MSEPEAWMTDVVTALERRIVRSPAQPDFLDVVERAHAIDPQIVPLEAIACADEIAAASLEREAGHEPDEAGDEVVDAWMHDVRAAVERRVDARRERELPPLRTSRTPRGVWWLTGVAMAVAATTLLVIGVGQAVRLAPATVDSPEQALHVNEAKGAASGTAEEVAPLPVETGRRAVAPEPVPSAPVVEAPVPAVDVVEAVVAPRQTTARSDRARDDARSRALADEAHAHWRAGRRAQAQQAFESIVAKAGRSRAAEMAYADLFTLASQGGDAEQQRRWWKEYLRRFPRGRFADDARAGLCRSGASSARGACWQRYLDDFPAGSFRGEARSVTEPGSR